MNPSIEISGVILAESKKAYLIEHWKEEETWFPKSQMKIIRIDGNILTFETPRWLHDKKEPHKEVEKERYYGKEKRNRL